jgi:ankyrin repeat protein
MMNLDDYDLNALVRRNDIEGVRHMLSHADVDRVNVQLYNSNGSTHTLLETAIDFDRVAMVELLLQHGANVNTLTHTGYSPLNIALRRGTISCPAIMLLLLKYGANIETPVPMGCEFTPLHMAILCEYVECTRILLENGANVDAPAFNGNTPLMEAVRSGLTEIFHILLEFKPNIFIRNRDNDTAESCGYTPLLTDFALEYQRQRSHMTTILRDLRKNTEEKCFLFALGQCRYPASGSQVRNLDDDLVKMIIQNVFGVQVANV